MGEILPEGYSEWLKEVKQRILASQQRAALKVNQELLQLYWHIGHEVLVRQKLKGWGAKIVARLAEDIKCAFPDIKGFSRANLMAMRQFAENWPDFLQEPIVQQAVGQIPWGHNLVLLSKLKDRQQRLDYANKTQKHGWSRAVLEHQIATGFLERNGNAVTNFAQTLPSPTSELAQQTTKSPYVFDFLALGDKHQERELEIALIDHISQFLVELGVGFAYMGRQFHLEVGGDDFYIDLLFYHVKLHCYVVVELKTGTFKPADLGQLNFYLTAVDRQVKAEQDAPTIGLLLCRSQNRLVAEYALADMSKPMGIAEYELSKALPADLEDKLPSIERIEQGWFDLFGGFAPENVDDKEAGV